MQVMALGNRFRVFTVHSKEAHMDNVFLYAARDSNSYRQVQEHLSNMSFNGTLRVLPPGSQFSSPMSLHLRSNDIIVLFAENNEEMEELLCLHDEYECFRIILVLKCEDQVKDTTFMLLSPRFISYLDSNINDMSEYITNLLKK